MTKQTGARYIKRQRENNREKETVITHSVKYESELVRISKNVVRRKR